MIGLAKCGLKLQQQRLAMYSYARVEPKYVIQQALVAAVGPAGFYLQARAEAGDHGGDEMAVAADDNNALAAVTENNNIRDESTLQGDHDVDDDDKDEEQMKRMADAVHQLEATIHDDDDGGDDELEAAGNFDAEDDDVDVDEDAMIEEG